MTPFLASTVASVELLFAVLAVVAQVALAGLLAVTVSALLGSKAAYSTLARMRDELGPQALGVAWLAAVLATFGSLWFSLSAGFTPCLLCWYQRTMMYPLVLVAGVGALTRDVRAWRYVLPPALLGTAISIYHYQLEWFPDQHGSCDPTNPCTLIWFREFGYITMPLLALTAFAVIIAMSLIARAYEQAVTAASADPGNEGHDHG